MVSEGDGLAHLEVHHVPEFLGQVGVIPWIAGEEHDLNPSFAALP
jgi:hypothetical protein